MMNMQILELIYIISVGILILGFFIVTAFVIPLQRREANVKNGLAILRRQLLWVGYTIDSLILTSILVLTARFFNLTPLLAGYFIVLLVFAFAVGFVILGILGYKIYHTQYTDENKELHAMKEDLTK